MRKIRASPERQGRRAGERWGQIELRGHRDGQEHRTEGQETNQKRGFESVIPVYSGWLSWGRSSFWLSSPSSPAPGQSTNTRCQRGLISCGCQVKPPSKSWFDRTTPASRLESATPRLLVNSSSKSLACSIPTKDITSRSCTNARRWLMLSKIALRAQIHVTIRSPHSFVEGEGSAGVREGRD